MFYKLYLLIAMVLCGLTGAGIGMIPFKLFNAPWYVPWIGFIVGAFLGALLVGISAAAGRRGNAG